MLFPVNLKIILATVATLVSTMSFAAPTQIDCAVSEPPNMFHDVIVIKEGSSVSVVYSYPGMRQDKWYGPFSGVYRADKGGSIFTFEDGTVISLNQHDGLGRSSGWVTLGLDGRQAEISCNSPRF